MFFFGAHNDFKILLNNSTEKMMLAHFSNDYELYKTCCNNLNIAGMGGLEPGTGTDAMEAYLTKYVTKGTPAFKSMLNELLKVYCSRDENKDKGIKLLQNI